MRDGLAGAVSRRPPIPLSTIVARIEGYTFGAKVWASFLIQGPFPVAPCPPLILHGWPVSRTCFHLLCERCGRSTTTSNAPVNVPP